MRRELNKISDFESITNVIIENQISTLAARMNSIQAMIVQYFIMKRGDEPINIEFISSSNKLKGLPPIEEEEKKKMILLKKKKPVFTPINHTEHHSVEENDLTEIPKKQTVNSKYKEHKKYGVYHCSLFIEHNPELEKWKHVLDTKKKDDYADCFLQGVWYIKNHGIFKENINYNLY